MTPALFILIIFGLLILILIIGFIKNSEKLVSKDSDQGVGLINQYMVGRGDIALKEHIPPQEPIQYQKLADPYHSTEFLNRSCTKLDDFIINDNINSFDLRKLAELNGVQLQIQEGWHDLAIQLIKELSINGWDKKLSCIKERFAEFKFSTNGETSETIDNIIDKYEEKAKGICQTCGERGEERCADEFVACRKCYLDFRGIINFENAGFRYEETFYRWDDIKDAFFEDPYDHYKYYSRLMIEFKAHKANHHDWSENKLPIFNKTIGYGRLLNQLPRTLPGLDLNYLKNFEIAKFCDICGYKALYYDQCECCENYSYVAQFTDYGQNIVEDKHDYIKRRQFFWELDLGEMHELNQKNYTKNPNHQVLFTSDNMKKYISDD